MLLWRQVADDIAEDISSGALSAGDRLPSELDLASCYGVSRITVRRALKELHANRLVRAVQGRGTFVEPKE